MAGQAASAYYDGVALQSMTGVGLLELGQRLPRLERAGLLVRLRHRGRLVDPPHYVLSRKGAAAAR